MKQNRPLSYSALKAFAKSPKHLLAYWDKVFTPSPAMALGSLIHTLILEPEEYSNRYFCIDDEEICLDLIAEGSKSPRSTKKYKEWKEEQLRGTDELIEVSNEDFKLAIKIADELEKHPLIQALTFREELIEWDFNGVPFKGYVDGAGITLPKEYADFEGQGYFLDIKTTRDASPKAFARDFVNLDYHLQTACYEDANLTLNFAGPEPKRYILAVETQEPFAHQLYEVSDEFVNKGYTKALNLIEAFKKWDGSAGGYSWGNKNDCLTLNPPAWL